MTATIDQMYQAQRACCAVCERHEMELPRGLLADYCSRTESLRGLLCSQCIIGLAAFDHSVERLGAAEEYMGRATFTISLDEASDVYTPVNSDFDTYAEQDDYSEDASS